MLQTPSADSKTRPLSDSAGLHAFQIQTHERRYYLPRDPRLGGFLLALCDLTVLAGVIALVAMTVTRGESESAPWAHFIITSVLSFIIVQSLARSYELEPIVHESLFDFVAKPMIMACVATTASYFAGSWLGYGAATGELSLWMAPLSPEHYVITFATLAIGSGRLLGYALLNRWQAAGHRALTVVLYGADTIGQRLIRIAREEHANSIEIVRIFDDRTQRTPADVEGIPVDGGVDALVEFVKSSSPIDKVLIALPMSAEDRICELVTRFGGLGVDVALVPELIGLRFYGQSHRDGHPLLLNVISRPPLSLYQLATERLRLYRSRFAALRVCRADSSAHGDE